MPVSDTEKSRNLAAEKTIAFYGSLIPSVELLSIIERTNSFIKSNKYYFDGSEWDKVFNEYSIFDKIKREFRVDRLMVNFLRKEVLIIDYKTGDSYDKNQINNYVEIVSNLSFIRDNSFNVKGLFFEIDLG